MTSSDNKRLLAEADVYIAELREIAGMAAQTLDGPLRWKQYRLTAVADWVAALTQQESRNAE